MRKLVTLLVVVSFCLVSQFAIAASTTFSLILVTYAQVGGPNALVPTTQSVVGAFTSMKSCTEAITNSTNGWQGYDPAKKLLDGASSALRTNFICVQTAD